MKKLTDTVKLRCNLAAVFRGDVTRATIPFLKINPVYRKKRAQNLVESGFRLNVDFCLFLGNVKSSVYKLGCTYWM